MVLAQAFYCSNWFLDSSELQGSYRRRRQQRREQEMIRRAHDAHVELFSKLCPLMMFDVNFPSLIVKFCEYLSAREILHGHDNLPQPKRRAPKTPVKVSHLRFYCCNENTFEKAIVSKSLQRAQKNETPLLSNAAQPLGQPRKRRVLRTPLAESLRQVVQVDTLEAR